MKAPSSCLKMSKECRARLHLPGRVFQSLGPSTEKDLSKIDILDLEDGIGGTKALIIDLSFI